MKCSKCFVPVSSSFTTTRIDSVPGNWLLLYWPAPSDCEQTGIHQKLSDKCCSSRLWFIFSLATWSIRTVCPLFAQYLIDCDSCDIHLPAVSETRQLPHIYQNIRLWPRLHNWESSKTWSREHVTTKVKKSNKKSYI